MESGAIARVNNFPIPESKNKIKIEGSKTFIINEKGDIISDKFDKLEGFTSDGISVFRKGESFGVVNSDGKNVLDRFYDRVAIDGEIIRIGLDGKWGFANMKGEVLCQPQYYFIEKFVNGVARFQSEYGHWGIINKEGEIVIKDKYDYMGSLEKTLIVVRNRINYGAIDIHGRVVIPFKYSHIHFSGIAGDTTVLVKGDEKVFI